jgi:hypothetical protein
VSFMQAFYPWAGCNIPLPLSYIQYINRVQNPPPPSPIYNRVQHPSPSPRYTTSPPLLYTIGCNIPSLLYTIYPSPPSPTYNRVQHPPPLICTIGCNIPPPPSRMYNRPLSYVHYYTCSTYSLGGQCPGSLNNLSQ